MVKTEIPRSVVVEFVAKLIRSDAQMPYSAIVSTAKKQGYHVYPLIMGLAKKKLGMGRKKPAAARAPGAPIAESGSKSARRGPGRPPRSAASGDLVATLQAIQEQLTSMRAALQQIAEIAAGY